MAFPSSKLIARGGHIYSHIYENATAGIARAHFWSITVDFDPIDYADESWDCSMTCEWLRFDTKRWTDIGRSLLSLPADDPFAESSFYMTEHDLASSTKLTIKHSNANRFHVRLSMVVDFHGYIGDDANPEMLIAADTEIEYSGLSIVPDNLFPKPSTSDLAKDVASHFVDVGMYDEPVLQGHRFILKPKW